MHKCTLLTTFIFTIFFCHIYTHDANLDFGDPEGWADRTFESMTLDEKIGQLFVVTAISNPMQLSANSEAFFKEAARYAGFTGQYHEYGDKEHIEDLIRNYFIGGIIYLQKGDVATHMQLTQYYRSISKHPLLVTLDCEAGLHSRLPETINFPFSMTLGALTDNTLIYQMGRTIAEQCKLIGVDVNFAPVVDVNTDYRNPIINFRSFGDNKNAVADKGLAYMQGLQDGGVIACAKHFPGHGHTDKDSHYDLPHISKSTQELEECELYPFKKLIDSGVKSVMTAHLEIPSLEPEPHKPSSLSYAIVTDLLREKMAFDGLIFTDALIMRGATRYAKAGDLELKALLAGNDILLCPTNVPAAVAAIKQALEDGSLSADILDQHVMRILRAKEWLLMHGGCKKNLDESKIDELHSSQALSLKDMLYSQAITLCGHNDLPTSVNPVAVQLGGIENNPFMIPVSQHFSISNVVHMSITSTIEDFDALLSYFKDDSPVLISIHNSHHHDFESYGFSPDVITFVNKLREQCKKLIITLFITPYAMRLFDKNDTIIIAYEDDASAQRAAANVLCGHAKATGVLPIADMRA